MRERRRPFFIWFTKVTGVLPLYLYIKPKIWYEHGGVTKRSLPKSGSILVTNHRSLLDFITAWMLFPTARLRFFMAEVLYNKNKLFSWMLTSWGGIRIDRNSSGESDYISKALTALSKGDMLGICPEGRINRTSELLPFKSGAAFLALKSGAPVIPVYSDGNYGFKKRLHLMVGEPIDLASLFPGAPDDDERLESASLYIRSRVEELKTKLESRLKALSDRKKKGIKPAFNSFLSFNVKWSMYFNMMLFYRPRFHYKNRSIQGRRLREPMIVISNHLSFIDPPMLCCTFPMEPLHIIASEILYEKPALKWLLDHCGCIRIDRNGIDMDCLREIRTALAAGDPVGIFPEGHIGSPDKLAPFKSGAVLTALMCGVPILPVYIQENFKTLGRQHIWIGVPIRYEKGDLSADRIERLTRELELEARTLRDLYVRGRSTQKMEETK